MDIRKYILEVLKDEDAKNKFLDLYKFMDISEDKKIYMIAKRLRSLTEEENDISNFAREFDQLQNTSLSMRETLLFCHLMIEHYMDKFLKIIFPNNANIENPKFTFDQKLFMCVASNGPLFGFYSEIKGLNKIRNKYVHNLSYHLSQDYIINLKTNYWFKKVFPHFDSTEHNEILMVFTRFLCSVIYGFTQEELRSRVDISIPSYKNFL